MFGALTTVEAASPREQAAVLAEVAREFSPRIEVCSPTEIVLDLNGLTRLFGEARTIAEELRRTAADRGLRVRVAITGTRTAARLLVRYRAGLTIVEPGNEAAAVAPLPIGLLGEVANAQSLEPKAQSLEPKAQSLEPKAQSLEVLATFRRWGLRTLGDLAALPSDDLAARLGRQDVDWQRLARGEDARPLVPAVPEERFEQTLELEWPIEELEPLSFVLGRLMDALEAHLIQRDRGAAVLHVRLHLIKTDGTTRDVHERSLQLPVAIRDARTLRTLALLDLESNPPPAPIDRVTVAVDPTPARIVQFSLLTRPLPTPEQISTLMARLHALMGEERCGSPVTVDAWEPGAFAMKPFMPPDANALRSRADTQRHQGTEGNTFKDRDAPIAAIRRFRRPMPVRVHVQQGRPASVSIMKRGLSGGAVDSCAGPWRTSGAWWEYGVGLASRSLTDAEREVRLRQDFGGQPPRGQVSGGWDRDEWDVALADGPTYRLFRERHSDKWFLEGVVD